MISQKEELLVVVEPLNAEPPEAPLNVGVSERVGSLLTGALLVGLALRRRTLIGILSAVVGVALLNRGATGRCSVYKSLDFNTAKQRRRRSDNFVSGSVTVKASANELYNLWRVPENFSRIFGHFAKIDVTSDRSSHWVIEAPLGKTVEWDAWITEERPGEFISWKSSDDSELPNGGRLVFREAPGDKGTEAILDLHFEPPGGRFGKKISDILGIVPRTIALQALRRFKSIVETGEVPSVEFQPEGKKLQGGPYEGAVLERN